jgi:hypothetical protein
MILRKMDRRGRHLDAAQVLRANEGGQLQVAGSGGEARFRTGFPIPVPRILHEAWKAYDVLHRKEDSWQRLRGLPDVAQSISGIALEEQCAKLRLALRKQSDAISLGG